MKDPHKPVRVLAAFKGLKSLSRDNYEGSTQAGSSGNRKKQCRVLAAFQGGSNPYHGTIMKDPHKPFRVLAAFTGLKSLSRDNYERSTQAWIASWPCI